MLIRNWNPVDDNYLNSEEVRQQEDTREAQYQRDMEKYKLSINGDWSAEKPNKRGMNEAIGDYSEVWVLKLGWAKEQLSDVMSRRWLVSTN